MTDQILLPLPSSHFAIYLLIFLVTFAESIFPIGFFFPGTTFLFFVGYICHLNKVDSLTSLIILSFAGSAGSTVSYYFGILSQNKLFFSKSKKATDNIKNAERFFEKYGSFGMFIHRFIGPLRPIMPFVAGFLKMPQKVFLPVNIAGNIVSSVAFFAAGFFLGASTENIFHTLRVFEKMIFSWF